MRKRILFQGDSITDVDRKREKYYDLGDGYPKLIAQKYDQFEIINRGISGNCVRDLRQRWTEDCIDLKPDLLSIMIGINDTWRRYGNNDPISAQAYYEDYRYILEQVKKELPNTIIVIIEPYVLPEPSDRLEWREDLDPKIQMARKLAGEFADVYIPLDGLLAGAYLKENNSTKYSEDGVHPTLYGHQFIAEKWIEYVKKEIDWL
jgi:acyl-CoA thioesterase-1